MKNIPELVARLRVPLGEDPGISRAEAADLIERLEKDCDAADLYGRNAAGMGFGRNAPRWSELADETRQLWREEMAKREDK